MLRTGKNVFESSARQGFYARHRGKIVSEEVISQEAKISFEMSCAKSSQHKKSYNAIDKNVKSG
jgi:hypothetical protein